MDDLRPQALPQEISTQPEAINLYRIAIYALAAIALIVVIGVMALSAFVALKMLSAFPSLDFVFVMMSFLFGG